MAQPKILVISNYTGSLNAIRPEAEIFLALVRQGFDITVMSPKNEYYTNELEKLGVEIIDCAPTSKFDGSFISKLKEVVSRKEINIVHAFNSRSITNASIALLGRDTLLVGYRGYTGNIRWFYPSKYLSFLSPRVDYMICLADSIREMFLKNGMPARKAVTILKGHHPDWYSEFNPADLTEFNLPPDAMICSLVANNRTTMKGLHSLIEATNLLPELVELRILLIGGGMDTTEIKGLIARSKKPETFIFTGFRSDVSNIVKAVDLSISVSLFGEATQKAMIEAMYLGNPVIISDIPGNRGMAIDGEGGYVIEPNNPKSIAEAIVKFHENPSQWEAMGDKAKKHITQFLSHDKTVEEYGNFYTSIVRDK
ncbi:MAG TPA: hypothetical protein DCX14_15260 [Flavobacteriales bacterium]|jgi:L-malate glycosyltransferase|nr:glycosyltransferase [Flavobacteriales bacterium]HAW21539.1 hypothetical protein [Flavobacteriales bacterium]